jgi:hypothetical protein
LKNSDIDRIPLVPAGSFGPIRELKTAFGDNKDAPSFQRTIGTAGEKIQHTEER